MTNYKEQVEAGQSWQRAYHVAISNKFGESPTVTFAEETVALLGGAGLFSKPLGPLTKVLTDLNESFPLVAPINGATSMTYLEMQTAIYSAYLNEAAKRDSQVSLESSHSI